MTSGLWPSRSPHLKHFDCELHGILKYRFFFFWGGGQDHKEFEENLLRFKVGSVVCYRIFSEGLWSS